MSVDPDGVWPEYRSVGQTGIYVYPGDSLDMPEYPGYLLRSAGISIDMPAYLFGMLCRSREAGLPILHGSLVRYRANGYIRVTRVNQGVTSLQSRRKTS
jgi:hypothetical protein